MGFYRVTFDACPLFFIYRIIFVALLFSSNKSFSTGEPELSFWPENHEYCIVQFLFSEISFPSPHTLSNLLVFLCTFEKGTFLSADSSTSSVFLFERGISVYKHICLCTICMSTYLEGVSEIKGVGR